MRINLVKSLCQISTTNLMELLYNYFKNKYVSNKIIFNNDYLMVCGDIPICLVAHADTIAENFYQESPEYVLYDNELNIIHALGGCVLDDRLGIYAIVEIIEKGYRPSIIITTDEETGDFSIQRLLKDFPKPPFKCNYIIELDRQGEKDAVYYQCNNKKFIDFISSFGFNKELGTFSDIFYLIDGWNIAAVNLSIGYLYEHSSYEYAYCLWTDNTINKVIKILDTQNKIKYKAKILN